MTNCMVYMDVQYIIITLHIFSVYQTKRIIPTQKPKPSLSMCAPLGCPHNADKKKVKKKKRKSAAAIVRHHEGQSWMSVQITKRHQST